MEKSIDLEKKYKKLQKKYKKLEKASKKVCLSYHNVNCQGEMYIPDFVDQPIKKLVKILDLKKLIE